VQTLETFTVGGNWSHTDAARASRLILRKVQGCVDRFETDIPAASAVWAYDATVWNSAADAIVSLADEAESIVLRINRPQYAAIAAALGDTNLVRMSGRHRS
jgi:hypothetical protein